MTRTELLNKIIKSRKYSNYAEIGVFYGKCFLDIKCTRKIAIDPDFRIPWEIRKDNYLKKIKRKFFNRFELYFKQTSDDFFNFNEDILTKFPPQLIFIDGLHTYEQTLRDVNNSLKYLSDDGIIVLHDCNPENESQALPAKSYQEVIDMNIEGWDGVWNGDVWKTIAHLRAERLDLDIAVLNADCGLGIIKKAKNKNPLKINMKEIHNWDYSILSERRKEILNLIELKDLSI